MANLALMIDNTLVKENLSPLNNLLFEGLSVVREKYDKQRKKNDFNIITALHKERDEVNLHSRIISYLLCPMSGHGMEHEYSKIFIRDILRLSTEQFDLSSIKVLPNETSKTEYKEIDILIVNRTKKQAIIIENKIDARDSNNFIKREGYQGQLERYFNTIRTGIDKDDKRCDEYKSDFVYVYYLSMDKKPSNETIGTLKNFPASWKDEHILSYSSHIREWLKKCIEITPIDNEYIRVFIQHYLNLINKMTSNELPTEEKLELKKFVSENIASSKYLIDNFKHIKWHTIHEFWNELAKQLSVHYQNVEFYADGNIGLEKAVELVSHQNKDLNHGITFDVLGKRAYIAGFGKLSWGIIAPKKWAYFSNELISDLNLTDFSSQKTFEIIDEQTMKTSVQAVIAEIVDSVENGLQNLRE